MPVDGRNTIEADATAWAALPAEAPRLTASGITHQEPRQAVRPAPVTEASAAALSADGRRISAEEEGRAAPQNLAEMTPAQRFAYERSQRRAAARAGVVQPDAGFSAAAQAQVQVEEVYRAPRIRASYAGHGTSAPGGELQEDADIPPLGTFLDRFRTEDIEVVEV